MPDPTHKSLQPGAAIHALIPCAGSGSRAGADGPKQYRQLVGQPMVLHTVAAFSAVRRLTGMLVVVAPDDAVMASLADVPVAACGGASRAASVRNGLRELRRRGAGRHDWVLVHDAARCLVTPSLIDRLIDACLPDDIGGLLAQPLSDTLKDAADGRIRSTLPREGKWLAQTPQMFRIGLLERALEAAGDEVTDECAAVEALGLTPLLVPGSGLNFKVTWPEDFLLAEAVLRSRDDAEAANR